ncbi:uncharacterized protein LOC133192884 [Saccostrea echinata]|uniref:uncharacterized protein LOC133192884 n=1 Tax=Saccostrea echinata TaxID=191078 RepID=UPI002A80946D|nr:uncharacterized protein LOC133192884 [Saccostrea echinata]
MHWVTSTFMVFLCTFIKAESLLFHGQYNATSASNGHSDPAVYKQLLHLETVLVSIMMDQKQQAQKFEQKQNLIEGEIQMLKQWNQTAQMKISLLESENKILKERLDNLNSSSTSPQQNLTISEDLKRLENFLTFEIEQTVRDSEEKMMKNMSTTIKDFELRDRYLSLSLLDVHSNMTILDHKLSKYKQQQKTHEEQQNMTIQHLSLCLLDVHNNMTSLNHTLFKFTQQQKINEEQQNMTIQHLLLSLLEVHNNTAALLSSLSSLDVQQKQIKREIQTLTNSQQNDIAKLNNTIIHLKNRVQSNVAFTVGIGSSDKQVFSSGQTDKFPTVIYQVGGGYNPSTGVFTAPKTGLYLIFCTNVADNHESFWTRIIINGYVNAGVMAYVGSSTLYVYQSASNLVVHQLQVEDRVWIQVNAGNQLYSSNLETTFSVIMINGSD